MTRAEAPLTTDDGEVRNLAEDDLAWFVSRQDFVSDEEMRAFLERRSALVHAAEAAGIPRATFLPFEPSKPGFEERAKRLMDLPKAVGWAAE